jgi:glycosyltransferase involved in cell wall biosynthesis
VSLRVSVVTPSYNQGSYLERTVRSVLCQDYAEVEYVLWDACSTDETAGVLARYEPALDVLVVQRDEGQADALNQAFRLCTGDVLGYLNADDCLAGPSTLREVAKAFAEHPQADVIYGRRYTIDEQGRFVHLLPYRPFSAERLLVADYIPQEATFFRKRAYLQAGGYIDCSFDFAMDYELWLRLLARGGRFLSLPNCWGLFRQYAHQKSVARWHSHGLPEIARLHDRYLGRRASPEEMEGQTQEHFLGCRPDFEPEAHLLFRRMWHHTLWLHVKMHGARLDGWVDEAEINPTRLRRLRRVVG